MELVLEYSKESPNCDSESFWADKMGDFDANNKTHVKFLMQSVSEILKLDEYAIKRLEVTIKTELPFFAKKRLLAKKWLVKHYEY